LILILCLLPVAALQLPVSGANAGSNDDQ